MEFRKPLDILGSVISFSPVLTLSILFFRILCTRQFRQDFSAGVIYWISDRRPQGNGRLHPIPAAGRAVPHSVRGGNVNAWL